MTIPYDIIKSHGAEIIATGDLGKGLKIGIRFKKNKLCDFIELYKSIIYNIKKENFGGVL